MNKKPACEKAIRSLVGQWHNSLPERDPTKWYYSDFKRWADRDYSGYWNFRSTMGADNDAESWFDDEVRGWRRTLEAAASRP